MEKSGKLKIKPKYVMNNHDILILIIIATIVTIQLLVFVFALKKIRMLRSVFKGIESFKIEKIAIPVSDIASLTPNQAIGENASRKKAHEQIEADIQKYATIKSESDNESPEEESELDYVYEDYVEDDMENNS